MAEAAEEAAVPPGSAGHVQHHAARGYHAAVPHHPWRWWRDPPVVVARHVPSPVSCRLRRHPRPREPAGRTGQPDEDVGDLVRRTQPARLLLRTRRAAHRGPPLPRLDNVHPPLPFPGPPPPPPGPTHT